MGQGANSGKLGPYKAEVLRRFAMGETAKSIAADYGVTRGAVLHAARTAGVKGVPKTEKRNKDIPVAVEMYESGMTLKEIESKIGMCRTVIADKIMPLTTIRNSDPVTMDDAVFDEINEESAYWAGFLMADGCLHAKKGGRQQVLSLALKSSDIGHIEKFAKFMCASAKISVAPNGGGRFVAGIQITSQKTVDSLRKYGLAERKTYCAVVNSRVEFDRHFWRGMIDGDGCISSRRTFNGKEKQCPTLCLVGTPTVCRQFANFVHRLFPDYNLPVRECSHSAVISRCDASGRIARDVISVLYKNSRVSLDRKREIADAVIGTILPSDTWRREFRSKAIPLAVWCCKCSRFRAPSAFVKKVAKQGSARKTCRDCIESK